MRTNDHPTLMKLLAVVALIFAGGHVITVGCYAFAGKVLRQYLTVWGEPWPPASLSLTRAEAFQGIFAVFLSLVCILAIFVLLLAGDLIRTNMELRRFKTEEKIDPLDNVIQKFGLIRYGLFSIAFVILFGFMANRINQFMIKLAPDAFFASIEVDSEIMRAFWSDVSMGWGSMLVIVLYFPLCRWFGRRFAAEQSTGLSGNPES